MDVLNTAHPALRHSKTVFTRTVLASRIVEIRVDPDKSRRDSDKRYVILDNGQAIYLQGANDMYGDWVEVGAYWVSPLKNHHPYNSHGECISAARMGAEYEKVGE